MELATEDKALNQYNSKPNLEKILFEKAMDRVNFLLKMTGITIDDKDRERTVIQRLKHRRFYCFNTIWITVAINCEFLWAIVGVVTGLEMTEVTHMIPCVSLCVLGVVKAFSCMTHAHEVNEIVNTLRKLQSMQDDPKIDRTEIEKELVNIRLPFLYTAISILLGLCAIGVTGFIVGPLIVMAVNYYNTGEVNMLVPFLLWYPFDQFHLPFWPCAYLHQSWSAHIAVFTVLGPDSIYYTLCTFIYIQFRSLRKEMEKIITETNSLDVEEVNDDFRSKLGSLIQRHKDLIRCVTLLENIFSKSILFNVVTSSVLICLTGFNITVMDDLISLIPFAAYLPMSSLQIFLLCYYGDNISRSSMELGAGVYNCQWYRADPSVTKDLNIILMRSQDPCKLTAYGFSHINLNTFTRILSSAWSYFALLKTVYREEQV